MELSQCGGSFLKYGPKLYNYGFIPQTWEDPRVEVPGTDCDGDGDPLDAIDLADTPAAIGDVKQVKVLGTLALIDCDEADWKVITIDVKSPLAGKLNGVPM